MIFLISVCFYPDLAMGQDIEQTKFKIKLIADGILKDATFKFVDKKNGQVYSVPDDAPDNAQLAPQSAYTDWRYWNGVLNIAMLKLGKILDDDAYTKFAIKNVAFGFAHYKYFENKHQDENKWAYPFGQFFMMEELDDCGAIGASVIEVYQLDKQEKYRQYILQAAQHIMDKQSRMEDETFVRSFPYKWTLWADDLYMSVPFLVRMWELEGSDKYLDRAVKQVINFHQYLFDTDMRLMSHCWYSDLEQRGVAFWGRANGWALVAQVDLLDKLPINHPKREELILLLKRHIFGISRYQDANGLWHQLLDKPDSYAETSCSAMFIYTIARSVNKGYIDKRFKSIAEQGWKGILQKISEDGQVEGVCTGTVVSDNLVDYYHRPAPHNDVHGIGTVLLCGAEVLQMMLNQNN
ncbi:MAG: glycosyl hydrolase [Calditrichaeota bacterium]|nr:MAG: glycosyl hydrolase [Calditrichota bacterium]